MTTAFAFDAETGERLSLSDVAINADALSMQLEEQVLQQMEQAPEQYFSDAQQWVPQLLEDGCWYFSEDGVVLLSNPRCAGSVQRWNAEVYRDIRGPDGIAGRTVDTGPAADSQGEPQIALTADDGAPRPHGDRPGRYVRRGDGPVDRRRAGGLPYLAGHQQRRRHLVSGRLLLRRRPPGGRAGRGP